MIVNNNQKIDMILLKGKGHRFWIFLKIFYIYTYFRSLPKKYFLKHEAKYAMEVLRKKSKKVIQTCPKNLHILQKNLPKRAPNRGPKVKILLKQSYKDPDPDPHPHAILQENLPRTSPKENIIIRQED